MAAHTAADAPMTRPTAAQLAFAKSTPPVRRASSLPTNTNKAQFAQVLQTATSAQGSRNLSSSTLRRTATAGPDLSNATYHAAMLPATAAAQITPGGPAPMSRSDILKNAEQLMGIPYVWGGNVTSGLDCSAFVSKAWGVSRHTTDNLSAVATPIAKDELQAGDALNLTTGHDPDGDGHVRLFDRWANPEHTKMYVYEETPPKSIHHAINWDPKYQPMRRTNVFDA